MLKILITLPNLKAPGGVSAFWNALLPEFKLNKGWEFIPLEIGGHGKNPFGVIVDQLRLFNSLNKADLVVLNPSLGARSFFRDALFSKQLVLKKKKFVVFFHGWDLEFENLVSKRYVQIFKGTFAKAEQIFVLSKDFGHKLREWGYTGQVTVETTTIEGSLIEDFAITEKNDQIRNTDKVRLLFMSRLVKEKGIFETIYAFRGLKRSFPNIELLIAGDGEDFGKVREETKNDTDIVLLGHVSGKKKKEILLRSHVFCLPSYTEGLPTSVLEAMAFGMPIITTPVGGLKYFFKDGQMGYFVDLKDKDDMVDRLEKLVSDKETLIRVGNYNHDFALKNLIASKVAQRLGDSFTKIMGSH